MTNLKNLAKRTIAVVITLTLLLSMCITAAVPATASTATVDVSSLTSVATAADDYVVNRVYKKLTNITGGGVNIAFTQYGGYEPYHYPVNMGSFDAIDLYFSKFVSKNASGSIYGNKKLLLLFANSSAGSDSRLANQNKFKPETVGILIDTIAGSLELVEQQTEQITSYTTYQTIVSDSVLKYDNFTGKDFKVSFNKNGTGLDVAVDVDGTVVSGTITAENLAKFKYCPTDAATYVSIGSVDSGASIFNNWSVNFYGYKKTYTEAENSQVAGGTISSLVSAISALPTTVTIDDASAILSAQARYDSFGDAAKKRVTNAARLATAYATLLDVFAAKEHEANATYYAAYPSVDGQFPNSSYRTLYSSKTADGVKIDFNRAVSLDSSTKPLRNVTLTGKYALDGLHISLKNYTYTKQSDFYLAFTNGNINDAWDASADLAAKQLVLILGRDDGKLLLAGCGMTAPISLGTNNVIERSNMVGKDIGIDWCAGTNGDYYVYITVGTQIAGFRVSADQIAAATGLDVNNVRVILSTASYGNDFEVEIDGIYAKTSGNVLNAVNAIASLSDTSSESAVNSANAAYLALTSAEKLLVLNYPKLNTLLQKFTSSEGYFVPTVDDVYDNAPEQKALAVTEAANGGIKIDANGAVFGMRTALKDRFVGEDITLRFNNYNYNNGSLIVGLTSSVNPGAIWNLEAATGRFGVYFCIGYNNGVWVTVPYQENKMTKILTDASLSNDNLMNKEFFVNIKCTPYIYTYSSSAGPISVTRYKTTFAITVDGKTLTANIDEKITTTPVGGTYSGAMDQFKPDEAQVVIESLAGYNPETGVSNNVIGQATSIELTGIKSLPYGSADAAKVDAVIAAINALPDTASLSIRDQVDAVWNQYFELITPAARAGVTNYSKLKALHDGIFNLRRGSSIVTEYVDVDVVVNKIDNSSLVTPYVDDSQVEYDSTGIWPEWTKDLVMAEVNLSKATKGGTILKEDVEPLLQHLAETGINGLWILPVNDTGVDKISPYCNYGPHTINPYLTGILPYGTDYSEFDGKYTQGFANFKEFVDLAHSYNIRIFMDIVPWGVSHYAPIVTEHPEYFYGNSSWGGKAYDENNKNGHFDDLEAWYMDSIVDSYLATGVDGIRWDLEPNHFGFDTVEKVLDTLKAAGKKPLFFSEDITSRSDPNDPSIIAYAFEQCYGVTGKGVGSQTVSEVFFKDVDIVKAIKTGAHIGESTTRPQWATNGAAKYYAYQMSSHDVIGYHQSSLASWAYEYAFSSFIPIFYVGEEWQSNHNGGLTGLDIKWSELEDPAHAEYFESVKKLLGLRWMYKDILNSTVDNHKNTNICSVDVIGSDHVKGYARYAGNEAIVVVPNVNEKSTAAAKFTVELPISDMGLTGYNYYTVTDMLTGDMVVSGSAAEVAYFSETIEHNTAGVYLVSGNATDVTWSVNESGTLVISGKGAVQDTPWASANTTVNKVVVESGITSLPADAFANFEELTTVCLPATVTALPNMAQDTVVIVVEGSAAERLAKAAGYTVAYNSELEIDTITVVVGDGSKTVEVVLDASCAGSYTDIKAIFGTTVVTEYETIGKKFIFKYTTTDEDVTIKLEGTDVLGESVSTDTASINLSRINGAAGTRYVQYLEIDCGDANGDGVTDIKDLVRAKKMVAHLVDSNSAADLSGDGEVAAADLTLLAKLIVKGKKGMEAYTVTFADAESDVIYDIVYVPAGFKASTDVLPTKEDTFFAGWDKSLANVSEDMVVYATFSNDVGADFSEDDLSGTIPEDWEYDD